MSDSELSGLGELSELLEMMTVDGGKMARLKELAVSHGVIDEEVVDVAPLGKLEYRMKLYGRLQGKNRSITAAVMRELADVILDSSWSVCSSPLPYETELIDRDDARDAFEQHLRNLQQNPLSDLQKCPLLGTSGVPGVGKTRVLQEIVFRWCEDLGCCGVYMTFNGGSTHGTGTSMQIFVRLLLRSLGCADHLVTEAVAVMATGERAIECILQALRQKLGLDSEKMLLVAIDEIVELDRQNTDYPNSVQLIADLMRVQDCSFRKEGPMDGKVVFVFSSVVGSVFQDVKTESGRPVRVMSLRNLPAGTETSLLPPPLHWRLQQPLFRYLVLQCRGHPRLVADGILAGLVECRLVEHVNRQIIDHGRHLETSRMGEMRAAMLRVSKFDFDMSTQSLTEEIVIQCLKDPDGLGKDQRRLLDKIGLICASRDGRGFLLPVVLYHYAYLNERSSTFASWLHELYNADEQISDTDGKWFERITLAWIMLQKALHGVAEVRLGDIFGPHVHFFQSGFESAKKCKVRMCLPGDLLEVERYNNFDDLDDLISELESGSVAVSLKPTEHGVERYVPLFVGRSNHRRKLRAYCSRMSTEDAKRLDGDSLPALVILAVQDKFCIDAIPDSWGTVCEKLTRRVEAIMGEFDDRVLCVIPVVMSTVSQVPQPTPEKCDPMIVLDERSFGETMIPRIGVLRFMLEKGGKLLRQGFPWMFMQ